MTLLTDVADGEMGIVARQLGRPSERGRTDDRATWQCCQRAAAMPLVQHECVARILALQHRPDGHTERQRGGQVFQRVYDKVHATGTERILQVLGEERLFADLGQ